MERVPLQSFVGNGLRVLGEAISHKLENPEYNPCRNSGAQFENIVFSMNSYCWCDGGHPLQ